MDMATWRSAGLEIEIRERVCHLILNRPDKRNALSQALLDAIEQAQKMIAAEPQIHVVVVRSLGPVFSSGHDLSEMVGKTAEEYARLFETCSRVMHGFRRLPQPVVAQVQGIATAAGCQLVAACDLVVASTEARFITPGVKIGLFCTTPMVPLTRAVPARVALEMLFTGQPLTAQRAYELGFVNRLVPPEELEQATQTLVNQLLSSSRETLRLGKAAFYQGWIASELEAYRHACQVMTDNALIPDAQEGIRAFLEKRQPIWQHDR